MDRSCLGACDTKADGVRINGGGIKAIAAGRWALILLDDALVNGEIPALEMPAALDLAPLIVSPFNVSLLVVATLNIFDLAVKKIRRKVKLELVE